MKHIVVFCLVILSACAPKSQDESAPVPSSSPVVPAPVETSSNILCGDTLIWTLGMTFKFDVSTGAVVLLSYGEYGHGQSRNGWGVVTEACHYCVTDSLPPYQLKEPLVPNF